MLRGHPNSRTPGRDRAGAELANGWNPQICLLAHLETSWQISTNSGRLAMRVLFAIPLLFFLLTAQADAPTMRLTIYDDGKSCPGDCDAHVVTNPSDNGTRFVSDPASPRSAPRACTRGRDCRICFGEAESTCMTALYRGSGPSRGTIDATPAFYAHHCDRPAIPTALAAYCRSMDRAIAQGGYDRRVNCLAEPTHFACTATIARARAAQAADERQYAECRLLGEAAYNRRQPGDQTRRSLDCAYSKLSLGGPNSSGRRWRLLMPGACRPGTYVGRDGLDCCSADVRFAASNHRECSMYFPPR
jgi:hypothetical protein